MRRDHGRLRRSPAIPALVAASVLTLLLGATPASASDGPFGPSSPTQSGGSTTISDIGVLTAFAVGGEGSSSAGVRVTYRLPPGVAVVPRQALRITTGDLTTACFRVHVDLEAIGDAPMQWFLNVERFDQAVREWERDYGVLADARSETRRFTQQRNVEREANGLEPIDVPEPYPPLEDLTSCPDSPLTVVPNVLPALDMLGEHMSGLTLGTPSIAPGRGLTGLTAYLETGRPLDQSDPSTRVADLALDFTTNPYGTPVAGTVTVEADATYVVDWGDGTVDGPFATEGRPYSTGTPDPALDVTHAYRDKSPGYAVTVTDIWTVTVLVDVAGVRLEFSDSDDFTSAPLLFPVDEVRSVRDR